MSERDAPNDPPATEGRVVIGPREYTRGRAGVSWLDTPNEWLMRVRESSEAPIVADYPERWLCDEVVRQRDRIAALEAENAKLREENAALRGPREIINLPTSGDGFDHG